MPTCMWQQSAVLADMPRLELAHCPHQVCPFHDEAHHLCPGFRAQLGVASDVCLHTRGHERAQYITSKALHHVLQLPFRSEEKMPRRPQTFVRRTWRAVNHGSCGRMSQQLRLSRAWSPAEMPLGLKSSIYGCQRYALNRLFVQQKNTCGALGRSHTFLLNHAHEESHDVDACYRHLNNFDAGDASFRGAPR